LSVLSAYTGVVPGMRPMVSPELERAQQRRAEQIVQEALATAREVGPGLAIDGRPVLGDPSGVLLDASSSASCLVVGGHGRGRLAGLLAGSVSQQVAVHARCPVAVVRGRSDAADGPVVVGVDGSASSHLAVDLAFKQAAARGCAVTIVFAYEPPLLPLAGLEAAAPGYDDERLRTDIGRDFRQAVARWRDQHPAVQVDQNLATGQAGSMLVERSHEAQLVVVGSRGRGGFAGLLLGSVGMHLLHQADCPILIAHGSHDES
jgi:nucleotide-binding universal stress UspA family protein